MKPALAVLVIFLIYFGFNHGPKTAHPESAGELVRHRAPVAWTTLVRMFPCGWGVGR